ncbi:N6-adenosine-methyltransferase subunit METTL3-like [Lytechinus variegatus]|uniref:N6-adenosine-methyltransferase subunit METTL3-like n=1 Tax=Lytechinus variegatus TaxID=7654 RepID=UPI001BB147A8|nr:N6-adenosine-methyltransferase subunit METTL3-like [Lytechinus variegatus]
MASTLEALKKKREDLKAKLMRRKEITTGITENKPVSLKLEVSSSPIPPDTSVPVQSTSISSVQTGIKQEDGSAPVPIPKSTVPAGSQGISDGTESRKRKREESDSDQDIGPASTAKQSAVKSEKEDEVIDLTLENLLTSTSFKEQESKEMGQEIHDLLSMPTAKEKSIKEAFKSKGGTVHEFCSHGTRDECIKVSGASNCNKLHFRRIINKHTDESLGDCSFLNTCFHMDTCKYVHYEVEEASKSGEEEKGSGPVALQRMNSKLGASVMTPPQWIQCDLRSMDFEVLGKFSVIMADPPWDIHMELPYGTMQDDEMRKLNVPIMQDEGFLFLWVTGRAMELGRECLQLWGYKQVEELIWVKTNQLQRLIRTGRTGHWLNHGKEHCLCGVKGNPDNFNKGLDCDVIVAEVRQTSHKPDEIYGLIERLSPGTRKIELFGRMHNIQPNWVTLGNQLDGVHLVEPETIRRYQEKYPDNNALKAPQK